MASYSVASGEIGAYEKTLVAATADTVTFADDLSSVQIVNESTTVGIYVRVDGTAPTVAGAASYYVPPATITQVTSGQSGGTVVKLISSGTPKYSVTGAY
jgi:hypothetical protein